MHAANVPTAMDIIKTPPQFLSTAQINAPKAEVWFLVGSRSRAPTRRRVPELPGPVRYGDIPLYFSRYQVWATIKSYETWPSWNLQVSRVDFSFPTARVSPQGISGSLIVLHSALEHIPCWAWPAKKKIRAHLLCYSAFAGRGPHDWLGLL